MLLTCGAFTPQGAFLELPELDLERLQAAWQEAVFALYLAEDKIEPEVVENMRTWPHSGFSVDQSVYLPAGDRAGIERLVGYMTRCPFSPSRLVKVTETGALACRLAARRSLVLARLGHIHLGHLRFQANLGRLTPPPARSRSSCAAWVSMTNGTRLRISRIV